MHCLAPETYPARLLPAVDLISGMGDRRRAVADIISHMEQLAVRADQGFLQIAGRLRQVGERFEDISGTAADAAGMVSTESVRQLMTGFEATLQEMELFMEECRTQAGCAVARLDAIGAELARAVKLIQNFHERVGTLRLIRTLTSIQSASLGSASRGFVTVAANIDILAQKVRDRSTKVSALLRELHQILDRARLVAAGLEGRQGSLGRDVLASIRGSLVSLAGLHQSCVVSAAGMAECSAVGSREVGATIVSLQYHDITRQQMEHVREGLAALLTTLDDAAADAGMAEDRDRLYLQVGHVCRLQAAQLANSSRELEQAHDAVRDNLLQLSRNAADVASRTRDLFGLADLFGGSSLGGIAADLTRISDLFSDSLSHGRELAELVARVSREMERVGPFLEDIEYIGSEIKLIALNSLIKAAQMGPEGAAMGVLAEAVRAESEEVCRQTALIGASIVAIVAMVADGGEEGRTDAAEERFVSIRSDLVEASAALEGLNVAVTERLHLAQSGAEALSADIGQLLSGVDSEGLVRDMRTRAIVPLQELGTLAGGEQEGGSLCQFEQRYTMSSERRVHERFAAAGPPLRHHDSGQYDGGDLGRNVELF